MQRVLAQNLLALKCYESGLKIVCLALQGLAFRCVQEKFLVTLQAHIHTATIARHTVVQHALKSICTLYPNTHQIKQVVNPSCQLQVNRRNCEANADCEAHLKLLHMVASLGKLIVTLQLLRAKLSQLLLQLLPRACSLGRHSLSSSLRSCELL